MSKRVLFSLILFFAFPNTGNGAIIYVDRDNSCPGNGSSKNPYCSIQNAMNRAGLAAGDKIRIRNSNIAYDETAYTPARIDGTARDPIIIEPDLGHYPNLISTSTNNLDGVINLIDVNYWTVRNLRFDACSVPTTSRHAITAKPARSVPVRSSVGIVLTGNTISCWGGTDQGGSNHDGNNVYGTSAINVIGHVFAPSDPEYWRVYITATISNNVISQAKGAGINTDHNDHSVIENNTITGSRCGVGAPDAYRVENGIVLGADGKNNTYRRNSIHDFQSEADCYAAIFNRPEGYNLTGAGIYCDASDFHDTVEENSIYSISAANSTLGLSRIYGLFWESRCNNAILQHNLIHDIFSDNGGGIDLGATNCAANEGNTVIYNIVVNVSSYGFVSWGFARNFTVKNNVFAVAQITNHIISYGSDAISCGGNSLNRNVYYSAGGTKRTFFYGGKTTASFVSWKSWCNCDSDSTAGEPLFVNAPK
jgi:hypothetical protein